MKHLIAFLGYAQSRIQHPVYRQFVQAPFARRNASLLFLSHELEERELVHEVNELRRRENGPCELTFHLCVTLSDPTYGQQVVSTVMMIRRLYDCPSYVYCLLPDLQNCTDEQRRAVWKCLAAISNGVSDYPQLQLMQHCFLYHDATQLSLAHFLFDITQHPEALDELSRSGFIGKVYRGRRSGDVDCQLEFPAIFSTFNAAGVTYPEEEVRYYIHQTYLQAMFALSRPETNKVSMEQCNVHVEQLISSLPLSDLHLSLMGDAFIDLNPERKSRPWVPAEEYWNACLQTVLQNLEDLPREEWIAQLRSGMEGYYQTRFRDMGV